MNKPPENIAKGDKMTKEKNTNPYYKIRVILSQIIFKKYLNFVQNTLSNYGFVEFCKIECSVRDEQIVELIDTLPELRDPYLRLNQMFKDYSIEEYKVEVY